MTTTTSMLAIDLAKGGFQVCAIGPDGAVPHNRVLSRSRLTTLLAGQPAIRSSTLAGGNWSSPGWAICKRPLSTLGRAA